MFSTKIIDENVRLYGNVTKGFILTCIDMDELENGEESNNFINGMRAVKPDVKIMLQTEVMYKAV